MRQLTSLDAQFLALEDGRTQGHVSALGVFDAETTSGRRLDAALVRELVTARMHLLPTFRWRLAPVPFGLDHPYWVDDGTFDVEYHVQDAALPAPGTQRQLADLVAHLIGRQLDRAHPLWELYVIHDEDAPRGRRRLVRSRGAERAPRRHGAGPRPRGRTHGGGGTLPFRR